MKYGIQNVVLGRAEFTKLGESPCIKIEAQTEEKEKVEVIIWLTEKNANRAYKQMKLCGFDADERDITELSNDPTLLRGQKLAVDIFEEMWNGKQQLRVDICMNTPLTVEQVKEVGILFKNRQRSAAKPTPAGPQAAGSVPF